MTTKIMRVSLGVLPGITRRMIPIGWEPLQVTTDDYGLRLDVRGDENMPSVAIAFCIVDDSEISDVPSYCGRHLGSHNQYHVFEVNPRSAESHG